MLQESSSSSCKIPATQREATRCQTEDPTGMPKHYFMRLFSFETMPGKGGANPWPVGEKREHSGRQEHRMRPVPAWEEGL